MAYAIDVRADYGDGTRSRGLAVTGILYFLKYLLLIPHVIALVVVGIVALIGAWIGYWAILFTGRQPEGITRMVTGVLRWANRMNAWFWSATDTYPAFGFEDGPDGAQTTVVPDDGPRNRLLGAAGIIGLKWLLALPHLIVVAVLGYAMSIAGWVGFWIILFTGRLPEGLHRFILGVIRWSARVSGWVFSLTDEYPPFSLE